MELKDFVKATLIQIADGIKEAQTEVDSDMLINPNGVASNNSGDKFLRTGGSRFVQEIEINVGITEIEKEGEKAGIGIVTGFISGGAQGTSDNTNQVVSSVRFKIPVALPSSETPKGHSPKYDIR